MRALSSLSIWKRRLPLRYLAVLWLIPGFAVVGVSVLARRWEDAAQLSLQFAAAFLAFAFLALPRRLAITVLMVALALMCAFGTLSWGLTAVSWTNSRKPSTLFDAVSRAYSGAISGAGERSWLVKGKGDSLSFSFRARLLDGYVGWDWFRVGSGYLLTPEWEGGTEYTHVVTPTGSNPHLYRTFDMQDTVAGRTFKVELDARGRIDGSSGGCRGVWLQTLWPLGGASRCLPMQLSNAWRHYSLTWTAPKDATTSQIRVVLNGFAGQVFDVRKVQLFERKTNAWKRLAPLAPAEPYAEFRWNGKAVGTTSFFVGKQWAQHAVSLRFRRAGSGTLQVRMRVGSRLRGSGTSFAIRRARIHDGSSSELRYHPVASSQDRQIRQGLLYEQPNLGGHSAVAIGLALLSLGMAPSLEALVVILIFSAVGLTGSRAALIASLIGVPWVLLASSQKWKTRRVIQGMALTMVLCGVLLTGVATPRVSHLESIWRASSSSGEPARWRIWATAWKAFERHPLLGIGNQGDAFVHYWQMETSIAGRASPTAVTHAHNLWLQFAASYGVVGLVSALLISFSAVVVAWQVGRWKGLAVVVPILVLQVLDYTIFVSGVLYPLAIALNSLARHGESDLRGAMSFRTGSPEP